MSVGERTLSTWHEFYHPRYPLTDDQRFAVFNGAQEAYKRASAAPETSFLGNASAELKRYNLDYIYAREAFIGSIIGIQAQKLGLLVENPESSGFFIGGEVNKLQRAKSKGEGVKRRHPTFSFDELMTVGLAQRLDGSEKYPIPVSFLGYAIGVRSQELSQEVMV